MQLQLEYLLQIELLWLLAATSHSALGNLWLKNKCLGCVRMDDILKVPFFDALKSGPVETGQPYWLVEPWLASCSRLVCRCESGDLSNKHGQLSIASPGVGRPTYTYVDNNLYLMGNYTSEWMHGGVVLTTRSFLMSQGRNSG